MPSFPYSSASLARRSRPLVPIPKNVHLPDPLSSNLESVSKLFSHLQIGGGVLGDVWRTHERGRAIALYSLAPLLGPVIGPIAGAWVDQDSTWRWVFWSTSIVNCVVQGMGFLFLRESTSFTSLSFELVIFVVFWVYLRWDLRVYGRKEEKY